MSLDPRTAISVDYLLANAGVCANSVAWIEREVSGGVHELAWKHLPPLVAGMAIWLLEQGARPGDRIAWWSYNSLEWVLLDLACATIGAIAAPIDPRLETAAAKKLVEMVEPVLLLVAAQFQDQLPCKPIPTWRALTLSNNLKELCDRLVKQVRASKPPETNGVATILFTTGTSSHPKGVMLTHRNLITNAHAKLKAMPQFRSDHRVGLLPFSHAYARTCELTAWLVSASSFEVASGVSDLFQRIQLQRPSLLNAVPVVYERIHERWLDRGGEPTHLQELLGGKMRQLASGGAPIAELLRDEFISAALPIYQGYGLTETSPVVCSNVNSTSGASECLEGVGPPVLGVEICIDDEKRLLVRGDGVMAGYWKAPEETRSRLVSHDESGEVWLDSGDLAEYVGQMGAIRILGRSDDVVVLSNGYKLSPLPMEISINALEGVAECIVLPSANGGWKVLVKVRSVSEKLGVRTLREQIATICPAETRSHLHEVSIVADEWTQANGLLNFKGAKKRSEFVKRYSSIRTEGP